MNSRHAGRAALAGAILAAGLLGGCRDDRAGAPAAVDDRHLQALIDSMIPDLARLASLEPRAPVRLARRTPAEVRAYVEKRLDEELPPAALADLQAVYALLGLVPDTLDLRRLLLELYTEQIIGYYDPHAGTMYVVEGVTPETVAPVLAHELVHALQDQHVDLDSLIARERGNDRQTAAHAAVEGHATVVMFAFLAEQEAGRRLDPARLPNPATQLAAGLGAEHEQYPVFRTAPAVIRETMLFPYVRGADFVHRLWRALPEERPAPLGDWLPQSTEQVLHPEERFLAGRDEPTGLRLGTIPPGWRAVGEENQLGELEASIFLARHLGEGARDLARGWDGDTYRLIADSRERHALVWNSVWDDAPAADRFAAALGDIGRQDHRHVYLVERWTGPELHGVRATIADRAVPDPPLVPATPVGRGG